MIDIVKLLGPDNLLSQAILEAENAYRTSLNTDAAALARKAGIRETSSSCGMAFKYNGEAFNLVFEANLPSDHEHYWCIELLIDEEVEDDMTIPISVFDDRRQPIACGELRFYGLQLAVQNGKTSCTLSQLQDSLTKPKISFSTAASGIVHGHLTVW